MKPLPNCLSFRQKSDKSTYVFNNRKYIMVGEEKKRIVFTKIY